MISLAAVLDVANAVTTTDPTVAELLKQLIAAQAAQAAERAAQAETDYPGMSLLLTSAGTFIAVVAGAVTAVIVKWGERAQRQVERVVVANAAAVASVQDSMHKATAAQLSAIKVVTDASYKFSNHQYGVLLDVTATAKEALASARPEDETLRIAAVAARADYASHIQKQTEVDEIQRQATETKTAAQVVSDAATEARRVVADATTEALKKAK